MKLYYDEDGSVCVSLSPKEAHYLGEIAGYTLQLKTYRPDSKKNSMLQQLQELVPS